MHDKIQKNLLYPLAQYYLKENTIELVDKIKKFDTVNYDFQEKYKINKLRELVIHAYNTTKYYKHLFKKNNIDPMDIVTISDFNKIPILTKNMLREHYYELISKNKFKKSSKIHSGGTMGQSVYVLKDNIALSYDRAVKGKCIGWYNCSVGDKEFRIWAYPFNKVDNFKAYIIDILLNRRRISPIHIDEVKVKKIAKKINKFKPKIIYGWVSGLYKFSQIALDNGIKVDNRNIKIVIATAEKLYENQRKTILKCFGKNVIDEYGCSEAGVLGFECNKGKKHIQIENNYLEVINKDKYVDGIGELVVTNLTNYQMPLIRYKIGDLGKIDNTLCECGKTTPIISEVKGRILDYLIDSKGNIVLGAVFCYICFDIVDKYKAIKDFRVRQEKNGEIKVYYVPTEKFTEQFLKIFEKVIRNQIGSELNLNFIKKTSIKELDKGKPRYVVSNDERKF